MNQIIAFRLPALGAQESAEEGLGRLLGRLAKKKKVKQTDLAHKTNISRISINRFFRGKSEVRASDLVQILLHLGIDLEGQIQEDLKDLK